MAIRTSEAERAAQGEADGRLAGAPATDAKEGQGAAGRGRVVVSARGAADRVTASRGHRRPPARALVLVLVLAGLGTWWAVQTWQTGLPAGPLTASGTVEADELLLGTEVGGRITAIGVDEGASVRQGTVVVRLDDAVVRLQMDQADAAQRRLLELQAEKYELRAPMDGVVMRLPVRVGEVLSPGQTAAALADLGRLKLTLYVLERNLGQVAVGQQVVITADPYPGRQFAGTVTSINSRAEFTPRNVQTRRDRQNLVFGVKVRVDNPDRALKPGLPVDATFLP